jgi:hypothetical protein
LEPQREANDAWLQAVNFQGEILVKVLLAITLIALIASCSRSSDSAEETLNPQEDDLFAGPSLTASLNTYSKHAANRYFSGTGRIQSDPLRIDLSTVIINPKWLAANSDSASGTVWGVVGADGRRATFQISNGELSKLKIATPLAGELISPPVLVVDDSGAGELEHSASAVQDEPELRAMLSRLRNLPDASTVVDEASIMYSYSDPTERYRHGALGDPTEWGGLAAGFIDGVRQPDRFRLAGDDVFEGLYPLVADIDGDGRNEIVTTVSNLATGARLVVFEYEEGQLRIIAESEPIGSGFRWLHQIAVALFGPNGEIEIAVVRTPHIGGIAQFYRLAGDRLELVASDAGGYMSHVNGSRNLDQAVAGDFDGDGSVELVLPSRDRRTLIGLRRVGDSVEQAWHLSLGSQLVSNIVVATSDGGELILGAANELGELLLFQ